MNRQYSGPRPVEPPSLDLGPQQLCHQTEGPTRSLVPQPPRNGEPRAVRQGLTRPQGKALGPEFLWAWSSGGPVPPASAQARMRPHCRVTTWGIQGCQQCAFEVGIFPGSWTCVNRQVPHVTRGQAMQNLLTLASHMSSVLRPQEALGFGIRSRESGKQGSWVTV